MSKKRLDNILQEVPCLSLEEIRHFLHYLKKKIYLIGSSYHCKNGDFFNHPNSVSLLKMISNFTSDRVFLFTNLISLTQEHMEIVRKKGFCFNIYLHSFEAEIRKKLMGCKSNFNIYEKLNKIEKMEISYFCWVHPTKTSLNSGDFENTLFYLTTNYNPKEIYVQKPLISNKMIKEELTELNICPDEVNKIVKKFNKENLFNLNTIFFEKVNEYVDFIRDTIRSESSKKFVVLVPDATYSFFENINEENALIKKVVSSFGIINASSNILTLNDYIYSLNSVENGWDKVIIPKLSFDLNLDDITLYNINSIFEKFGKDFEILLM